MSKRKYASSFSTNDKSKDANDDVRFWCNPRKQMFGSLKQIDRSSTATATASASSSTAASGYSKNVEYDEEWCEPITKNNVSASTFNDAFSDRKTCERVCHIQGATIPLDLKNIVGNYLSETAIHDSSIVDKFLDKDVLRFRNELKENFPYLLDFNINDKRYQNYIINQNVLEKGALGKFMNSLRWIFNQLSFCLYLKFRDLAKVDPIVYKQDLAKIEKGEKISLVPYISYNYQDLVPSKNELFDLKYSVFATPHKNCFFLNELMYDIYVICQCLLISFNQSRAPYINPKYEDVGNERVQGFLDDTIRLILVLQDPNDYHFQTLIIEQTIVSWNVFAPYFLSKGVFSPMLTNLYRANEFSLEQFQSLLFRDDFIKALTKIRQRINLYLFPWAPTMDVNPMFTDTMFRVLTNILGNDPILEIFPKQDDFNSYIQVLCYLDKKTLSRYNVIISLVIEYYLNDPSLNMFDGWYLEQVIASGDLPEYVDIFTKLADIVYQGKKLKFTKEEKAWLEENRYHKKN